MFRKIVSFAFLAAVIVLVSTFISKLGRDVPGSIQVVCSGNVPDALCGGELVVSDVEALNPKVFKAGFERFGGNFELVVETTENRPNRYNTAYVGSPEHRIPVTSVGSVTFVNSRGAVVRTLTPERPPDLAALQ